MRTSISTATLTLVAIAAATTANRFVGLTGAVPAAGARVLGVPNADYALGDDAGVDVLGVLVVESGAAITAGADVQTDASGRAITLAAGAKAGWALDGATAAGELIRVVC